MLCWASVQSTTWSDSGHLQVLSIAVPQSSRLILPPDPWVASFWQIFHELCCFLQKKRPITRRGFPTTRGTFEGERKYYSGVNIYRTISQRRQESKKQYQRALRFAQGQSLLRRNSDITMPWFCFALWKYIPKTLTGVEEGITAAIIDAFYQKLAKNEHFKIKMPQEPAIWKAGSPL